MSRDLNLKLKIQTDAKEARAEIKHLTGDISKVGSGVADFAIKSKQAERNVGSLGKSGLVAGNNLVKGLSPVKTIILGIASALTGISLANLTEDVIRQNRELNNLTTTYKLNRQELQLWQIAMGKMGVSAEKVGDILKDTQDKVGDFLATGGGEAKDIFERLKLNAEELKNLQPDEILKKIVNRMDEIKDLSQNERVFLMESIADEASRLLPLLSNNAAKLEQIRETANASGAILSDEQNAVLQQASQILGEIDLAAQGVRNQIGGLGALFVTEFGDEALAVLQYLAEALKGIDAQSLQELAETAGFAAKGIGTLYVAVNAQKWITALVTAVITMQARLVAATGGIAGIRFAIDALTTRAIAGTVAMRGLNAVMGLLGGPAGIAVLAGSALAYMAYEADNERKMIERSNGSHINLSEAIQIATNASNQFRGASAAKRAEIKTEIQALIADTQAHLQNAQAVLKAAQARAAAARAATKISSYKYGGKVSETEAKGYEDRVLKEAANVKSIEKALKIEQDKLKNLGKPIKIDPISVPKIHIPKSSGARGVSRSSQSPKAGSLTSQKSSIDTLTSSYQQLEGRLDSAAAKQRAYNKDVETLNAAVKAGIIPKEREAELLKRLKFEYDHAGKSVESLRSAEQQYLNQLKDKHAELTLGEQAYQVYTLRSKGFSEAVIKEAIALQNSNKSIEEHRKAQKKAADDLKQLTTEVEDRLNTIFKDALFNGKNLFDSLKSWAKELAQSLVMKLVINPVTSSISGSLTQALLPALGSGSGGVLNAIGGGINPSGGGISSLLGGLSTKGSIINKGGALLIGNQIGEGIASIANQFGTKIGSAFSDAAGMTNFQLGGAALLGGLVGGAGQKGTYGSLGGSLGGLGAAALGLGPIGIGAAILGGGAIGGLFGSGKQVGQGVQLGYRHGDVYGNSYTTTDKGWLRGSSDSISPLERKLQQKLSSQFDSAEKSIIAASQFFGKSSARKVLDSYSTGLHKMDFRDLTDAALQEWFGSVTSGMVSKIFGADLNRYQRAGESLSDTLGRLYGSVDAVSNVFKSLGSDLDLTSLSAAEAASRLVDTFGGLEQFNAAMDSLQKNLDSQLKAIAASYADSIAEYNRLQRSAEKIRADIVQLRFNTNSALGVTDQQRASEALFNSTVAKASSGDETAASTLGSIAKQYNAYRQDSARTRFEARLAQSKVSHSLAKVASNIESLKDPQKEMVRQQKQLIAKAEQQLEQMFLDNLASVQRGEQLTIINDTLNTLPERIGASVGSVVNGAISNIKIRIPGFASGGDFGGGLAIVGEDGPELRQFGASRFTSFNKTKELFSSLNTGNASDSIQRKMLAAIERLTEENRQMKKYLKDLAKNSGTTAIMNKFSARVQLKPLGASL